MVESYALLGPHLQLANVGARNGQRQIREPRGQSLSKPYQDVIHCLEIAKAKEACTNDSYQRDDGTSRLSQGDQSALKFR